MRVFEEKQWFNQWWIHCIVTLPILGLLLYLCYQWYVLKEGVDKVSAMAYGEQVLVISLLVGSGLLIFIFKLSVAIDERGFTYQFFPIHLKSKKISWNEIESCQTITYSPLKEAGGWGYKFGKGGKRIMNIKGNKGIEVHLKNGKKFLFGTQKPEVAQKVIDKYFKK